ncbi:hypothetical protein [Rhodococcus tibetensis]|uniref:Uncharacterized protein n=1 Tax=Rhodococcus tibetensis TaxID=2965064 RepID=A0ABT1QKF6_9NOCA|nr:hypothetical protein [Rhodococcus sp. FXJ9.536]MCQ4122774.1 hypothetical protein [Rhodococcus sp. FXJ9.536]
MLHIQRKDNADSDGELTAEDFAGPEGAQNVLDLLAEHPSAFCVTDRPDLIVVVAGERLMRESGEEFFELVAYVHRIEKDTPTSTLDMIVDDFDNGLPDLTQTGPALIDEALDAIAEMVNSALTEVARLFDRPKVAL